MNEPVSLEVACACGASVKVVTHTWVNVETEPQLRVQLELGKFHNAVCGSCGKHIQIDKWFLFQDPARDLIVHVFPREYRHSYLQLQEQLVPLHRLCGVTSESPLQLVFGIEGLMALLRGETPAPPLVFPQSVPNHATRH